MKRLVLFMTIATLFCFSSCKTYNKVMVKKMREAFGKDIKDYSSFSFPTNNFGILTSYQDEIADGNFVCAMGSCVEFKPSNSEEWLNHNGLFAVGRGGEIKIQEVEKKVIAIDGVLPEIWETLKIEGEFKSENVTDVNLTMGRGYKRLLDRLELDKVIPSLPENSRFKNSYNEGSLVVVVADIVVESMSVKVKFDNETSGKIDTAINNPTSNGSDLELKFSINKTVDGQYEFNVSQPVIVMTLAKKQPSAGYVSGNDATFDNWEPVTNLEVIDKSKILNLMGNR